jgi:triosephosphate isomerase
MKFGTALSMLALLAGDASAFAPICYGTTTSTSALEAQRQPIMAGNWKMNPGTEEEALKLAQDVAQRLGEETCAIDGDNVDEDTCTEVVIFPPFPFISKVRDAVEEAGLAVGAQNFFFEDSGAFTGSVSASMVRSVGCEYVLCGHSERRTLFADSDVNINQKVCTIYEVYYLICM